MVGEVGSILLLGLDAERLAPGLALRSALLVGELGSLLHGHLLGALHDGLLVSIVVLACIVEGSLDELQHTVGSMEGLASTVVDLVLAHQLTTIGFEAVGGDDVLLLDLECENGVGVVQGILGSDTSLVPKGGSEGRTSLVDRLTSEKRSLTCVLDSSVVRLELALLAQLVLASDHLLVLGSRGS